MFSPEIIHLVNHEKHKDKLRGFERAQLFQIAELQPGVNQKPHRKAVGWLGTQMVKWGSKLQNYDPSSSSETFLAKT